MRGNLRRWLLSRPVSGSIPACAGEPGCPDRTGRRAWVYPRVCGGTTVRSTCLEILQGLSPRVRGNRHIRYEPSASGGSIPACAGEPDNPGDRLRTTGVYPRVCGGTPFPSRCRRAASGLSPPAILEMSGNSGLSPRVRGNPPNIHNRNRGIGSIPACAGEPSLVVLTIRFARVYPRVCGGTERVGDAPDSDMGLSPRVRGNRGPLSVLLFDVGSIPACAGEPRPNNVHTCP